MEIQHKINFSENLLLHNPITTQNIRHYAILLQSKLNKHDTKIKDFLSIAIDKDYIIKSLHDFYKHKSLIEHSIFDLSSIKNYVIVTREKPISWLHDTTKYKYIKKNLHYDSLNLFHVLKILYRQFKIGKSLYRNCILKLRNIESIKNTNDFMLSLWLSFPSNYKYIAKLPNKVNILISAYFRTMKSHNNKSSMAHLEKCENQQFITSNNYQIAIKKRAMCQLINNHNLVESYSYKMTRYFYLCSQIEKEHSIKLLNDKKIA